MRITERFVEEKNDCTVRALATASNLPYNIAYEIMAEAGRKPNGCIFMGAGLYKFGQYGGQYQCVYSKKFFGRRVILKEMMPLLQEGHFIVRIDGHVFAVIDGDIYDTQRNSAYSVVQTVWEVRPVEAND